jgi:hypothetical protein
MALTRLPKPVPDEFPPVRLYLDDLEEIRDLLVATLEETDTKPAPGEATTEIKTKFRVDDRVSPEIKEFENFRKRTHNLELDITKYNIFRIGDSDSRLPMAGITVAISGTSTSWDARGISKEKQLETYSKLEQVFNEKKIWWRALAHWRWAYLFFYLLPMIILLASMGVQLGFHRRTGTALYWAFLATVLVFFLARLRHSTVILSYSTDACAKREEIKSRISLILVTAAVTLVGTLLAQYILRKIFH